MTCNNTLAALVIGANVTVVVNFTVAAGATHALINQAKIGTNGADPQNNVFSDAAAAALCSGTDVPSFGCAADLVPLSADLQIVKLQRLGISGAFASPIVGVPLGTTL